MSNKKQREWKAEIADLPQEQLFKRWESDFELLSHDVHRIHRNREVFEALDDEIVRTGRDGSGFFLERFLRPMYAETQSLLLRRLGDNNRESSSFRRLLEEMILRTDLLTRERYTAQWAARHNDNPDYMQLGDDEFSTLYGPQAQHVPSQVLEQYRDKLTHDLERVKTFVDKDVAHQDRITAPPVTWAELNAAVDSLDVHLNAIGLIISGIYVKSKPTILDPWREVFGAALF